MEDQPHWIDRAVGGLIGFALLLTIGVFALDRCQAKFTPNQYAEKQAKRAAERQAEEARLEVQNRAANAVQAERDAAQRVEATTYALASAALSAMKGDLRDPRGAEFRDVWAVRATVNGKQVVAACGVVNAKNAFGAYVGDMPFMAAGSVWTPDTRGFAAIYQQVCINGEKVMQMY